MRKTWKVYFFFLLAFAVLFRSPIPALAETEYSMKNPETGYVVIVRDEASLLTDEERQTLTLEMEGITLYGNVYFFTLAKNARSARQAAETAYYEAFGNESGILLLIDMDNRQLWMSVNGAIYEIVTDSYCSTITDNIYREASKGDYYACASKCYAQVEALLSGYKIAEPMKHIDNALLAVVLGIILNFCFVLLNSWRWKKSSYGTMEGSIGEVEVQNMQIVKTGTRKTYSPSSKGGGGGGGSHGGGGGSHGGGGGFSGGGGGHSF